MSNIRIDTRWAKALIDLATEQGKLDAVREDMLLIQKAVANRDLANMLKSPIISADKKNAVLDAIFEGKVDKLTIMYLHLLTSKGRENELIGIAQTFEQQYRTGKGITSVKITSAAPLTEAVLNEIKAKLLAATSTADSLDVVQVVNPELIGGFVVEFGDRRYDASVASKLAEIKSQFKENLFIKGF